MKSNVWWYSFVYSSGYSRRWHSLVQVKTVVPKLHSTLSCIHCLHLRPLTLMRMCTLIIVQSERSRVIKWATGHRQQNIHGFMQDFIKWTQALVPGGFLGFFLAALSKVQNPRSPNGPPIVEDWVVRITFGWSVYVVVRSDNKTLNINWYHFCVVYFQPS